MTKKPDLDVLLNNAFDKAKKDGCSITDCTETATGIGDGKPYCQAHFWEEFDKKCPEDLGG